MSAEGDDAKRRRIEPIADGKEEKKEDVKMKEEDPESEALMEQEQDAKADRRAALGHEVQVELRDCTLNVVPTVGGRVLTPLTDGGLQYLVAGARANVGVRKGRYLFEVKIVETLNPFEPTNSRSSRAPVPRQLVRVGFSTQDSSLFLGETEESVCFDSEGFFTADKKRSATSQRFSREQTIGVLLNLDRKSPNADTVSLFRDGIRISQPQQLPENLQEKALFPHVNFKNVTLQVNFGSTPLVPLPFVCRTLQEIAKDDGEMRKLPTVAKNGTHEVLFPVGLPDEGTFDWLDGFLQKNPQYTEISDRTILRWAERSGLWRPNPSTWKNSNDKPEMNFGIPMMDDSSVRRVLNSVVATQPRNYIIMEVKGNLLKEERQDLLKRFCAPCYKKVAMIVVGEPTEEFKCKAQEGMLKEKQIALEQERLRKKVEKERRKALEKQQQLAEEAKRKLEEAAKARIEEAFRAQGMEAQQPRVVEPPSRLVEPPAPPAPPAKPEAAAVKAEASEVKAEVKEEASDEKKPEAGTASKEEPVKEEDQKEAVKKEEESEEEPLPVAELSEEEQKRWFRKKAVQDLTMWVLGTNFPKFTIPTKEEGFDEIRYAWQPAEACQEYLQAYILKNKVLCRMEDLQPSEWFRTKWTEWQKVLQEWHGKQGEWKQASAIAAAKAAEEAARKAAEAETKKEGEEGAPGDEAKEDDAAADDAAVVDDIMKVEDVCNIGKGEPLFARFAFEDWALLSLRLELHLLVHAFKKDVSDPERIGIHEQHLPFYYNKYYRKSFNVKYYGVESNVALVEMVKDCVIINPSNMVLEHQLDTDLESFDIFVKLTEEARRERQRRIDAGDETVTLKFSKPEVPPQKGVLPPPQVIGGGQAKGGGKSYGYQPRAQTQPYGGGGCKGGSYAWNSKSGGGGYGGPSAAPVGTASKGYGGGQKQGFKDGGSKGYGSYGKSYGK